MYLVWLLNDLAGASCIVFCATYLNALRVALMLRHLGFTAVPLHGQMSQARRILQLNFYKFEFPLEIIVLVLVEIRT